MKKLLAVAIALCVSLKLFAPGHYETVPEVWHNNAWHRRQKLIERDGHVMAIDFTNFKVVKLTPEELSNQGLSAGAEGYVDAANSKFVALTPEELAISDTRAKFIVSPEKLKEFDQKHNAEQRRKQDAHNIEVMRSMANGLIWHNGKWVKIGDRPITSDRKGIAKTPENYGTWAEPEAHEYYNLDDNQVVTVTQKKISDMKKKLWHKDAWHDAVWDRNNNTMNSYIDGSNVVTLTPAEEAISEAKKQNEGHYPR